MSIIYSTAMEPIYIYTNNNFSKDAVFDILVLFRKN